jgi:hypothetical protein
MRTAATAFAFAFAFAFQSSTTVAGVLAGPSVFASAAGITSSDAASAAAATTIRAFILIVPDLSRFTTLTRTLGTGRGA